METIDNPDLKRKVRKNLMIVFIIASIMFFAGFISAYIVSKGDVFWMKVRIPSLFWFNTALLILVSFLVHFALKKAKTGQGKAVKILLGISMLLGMAFFVLQVKAWKMMLDRGIAPITKNIIVASGRYGDYFTLQYNGKPITVDGNNFLLNGEAIDEDLSENMVSFSQQFLKVKQHELSVSDYGKSFVVFYKDEPISSTGNKLMVGDKELSGLAFERLQDFMLNIRDGRGDFYAKGKYGEDFTMYYKGKPVEYKNREFFYEGKELSTPMRLSMQDTDDKATAYFYLITVTHWFHVFAGVIVLMTLFFRSLKNKYTKVEYSGIAVGGLFWHFLDVLWVFLFLFLLFIH